MARKQFSDLVIQFPEDPLYAAELARLTHPIVQTGKPGRD
jgi:hypothetical protein